jgi:hypothetical protein
MSEEMSFLDILLYLPLAVALWAVIWWAVWYPLEWLLLRHEDDCPRYLGLSRKRRPWK